MAQNPNSPATIPVRQWIASRSDGGGGGGGNGSMCGPCGEQSFGELARATTMLRRAMKSGNINQGYAQCDVDELALLVESGQCPPERIQCRQPFGMRATGVAAGATTTFTVTPVGPAFLRELLLIASVPTDPLLPDFRPIVAQLSARGRFAIVGAVASTGAGNIPTGVGANAFARTWQNYVVPSGITFDSSNPLTVAILNAGADAGAFEFAATYDLIRMG